MIRILIQNLKEVFGWIRAYSGWWIKQMLFWILRIALIWGAFFVLSKGQGEFLSTTKNSKPLRNQSSDFKPGGVSEVSNTHVQKIPSAGIEMPEYLQMSKSIRKEVQSFQSLLNKVLWDAKRLFRKN